MHKQQNGNLKLNIYFLGDYEFTKDKASKLGGVFKQNLFHLFFVCQNDAFDVLF